MISTDAQWLDGRSLEVQILYVESNSITTVESDIFGLPNTGILGLTFSVAGNRLDTSAFENVVLSSRSIPSDTPAFLSVQLNFSSNMVTNVTSRLFSGVKLSSLDLRNNMITHIAGDAFEASFTLTILNLAHNFLTALSQDLIGNIPGVTSLNVSYNNILAMPISGGFLTTASAVGNPLVCESYGPQRTNCRCISTSEQPLFQPTNHCGYTRCSLFRTGCPPEQLPNNSDCDKGPWTSCVFATSSTLGVLYFDNASGAIYSVRNCNTTFPDPHRPGKFLPAYEYANYSLTSNRLCSICSSCPDGYDATPCTATSNSKCTKQKHLSPALIIAIALATVLVVSCSLFITCWMYQRKEEGRITLGSTLASLDGAAKELHVEKEEIARMKRAWAIDANDLVFGRQIGLGGTARVFEGTWGCVGPSLFLALHR